MRMDNFKHHSPQFRATSLLRLLSQQSVQRRAPQAASK
jgi:hypothetical protein